MNCAISNARLSSAFNVSGADPSAIRFRLIVFRVFVGIRRPFPLGFHEVITDGRIKARLLRRRANPRTLSNRSRENLLRPWGSPSSSSFMTKAKKSLKKPMRLPELR